MSHTVAQVLARRGLTDPRRRARVPGGRRRATRWTRSAGCATPPSSILEPRRGAAAASPSTATTTSTAWPRRRSSCACCARSARRWTGTCPAAPRTATGSPPPPSSGSPRAGRKLLLTADCAITAVDEVAAAARARAWTSWSPTTTRRAPTAAAGRADRAPAAERRQPVRRTCAPRASPTSWRARCWRPPATTPRSPTRTSTSSRWPPSPTSSRCTTRTARWCAPGCGRSRPTRKPGLRALMAVARVDPSAVDATAIGFRLAPRINAAGRIARADAGARAAAHRRRGARPGGRRGARRPQRPSAATWRRGCCSRPRRRSARTADAARLRARRRGLAPGRDRHRRRRASPSATSGPAVLIALDGDEGTGSGRSIPAFDLLAGLEAGPRHLLRHGGHRAAAGLHDRARRASTRSARRSTRHAAEVLRARGPGPGRARRRGRRRRRARPRRWPRSSRGWSRSAHGQPGRHRCSCPPRHADRPAAARERGPPRRLPACTPAARARARVRFGEGATLPDGAGRRRRPAGGQRVQRHASSRGWCSAARGRAPRPRPIDVRRGAGDLRATACCARARRRRSLARDAGRDARPRASCATCAAAALAGDDRRPRRHRRAGAGRGRPRGAPRARRCASAWAASRSPPAARWPPIRGSPPPYAARRRARPAAAARRAVLERAPGAASPTWRGATLSYALRTRSTNGNTPCASRCAAVYRALRDAGGAAARPARLCCAGTARSRARRRSAGRLVRVLARARPRGPRPRRAAASTLADRAGAHRAWSARRRSWPTGGASRTDGDT